MNNPTGHLHHLRHASPTRFQGGWCTARKGESHCYNTAPRVWVRA